MFAPDTVSRDAPLSVTAARRELQQAMRSLRATPVTSIAAITSLALGIAAATTVFSVIDGAMLRQPPFEDPSRLFILTITRSSTRGVQRERWSWTRFQVLRQRIAPVYDVASFSVAQVTLTGTAEPEPLDAEVVSPSYLRVLRVTPALGHRFADDDRPGANREVLLAHQVWRDRFGADSSIVGRPIELNGLPLTVAGVLPAGWGRCRQPTGRRPALWHHPLGARRLPHRPCAAPARVGHRLPGPREACDRRRSGGNPSQ